MKKKLEKKRKAITQALANLKIDGIEINKNYFFLYEDKIIESLSNEVKLTLKTGGNDGING